ncbi:MAG: hypothetical protein R3A52_19750 [Polyangiales bacterium]
MRHDPLSSARAASLCAIVGAALALSHGDAPSLEVALATRALDVVPGAVHWIDPPGVSARRALVLARSGREPADLYAVTARTSDGDRVVELSDVSNLTRSPDAEESSLTTAGPWAAFATRVDGAVSAVTVVDTRGAPREPGLDRRARLRRSITNLQRTGRSRGYGMHRFDLAAPADEVDLRFEGDVMVSDGAAGLRVQMPGGAVIDGADAVRLRPRAESDAESWITWLVDTVRALPWVGPAPIAWAESWAFRGRHAVVTARNATVGADTATAVAEDLADLLSDAHANAAQGRVVGWPPEPIRGVFDRPIAREGEWLPVGGADDPYVRGNPGAPSPMALTFVRTDRERSDARVYVVAWDPRQVELHVAPGSIEPMGATGETGTGAVPRDERTLRRLVAGFNGGFQGLHGEYGLLAEDALLLPPKPYAATVALMADGATAFGSWPAEQSEVPAAMVEFRQNLTAMVDGGVYNPWRRGDWGAVLNNVPDLRTARSGLCLTREGHVAFLWGDDISPRALGDAMLAARCDYGLHLDMNGPNTGFEFYRVGPNDDMPALARPPASGYEAAGEVEGAQGMLFRARKLVRGMPHHAPRYIRRNPRDFFYLLLRPVLPAAPMRAPVSPAQPGEGTWSVAGLGDAPFPWPMARARVRPDPAQPERWVNLVMIDPRRVSLAPADASEGVVARVVGAPAVEGEGAPRLGLDDTGGAHWGITATGRGISVAGLREDSAVSRGACANPDGFLVVAVADRPLPGLVWRALDLAGCGPERLSLPGAVFALPGGGTAAGDAMPANATPSLSLVLRDAPGGRRVFPEVRPVAPSVWYPVQSRRVRYFPARGNNVTVEVRLVGQRPFIQRLPGVAARYFQLSTAACSPCPARTSGSALALAVVRSPPAPRARSALTPPPPPPTPDVPVVTATSLLDAGPDVADVAAAPEGRVPPPEDVAVDAGAWPASSSLRSPSDPLVLRRGHAWSRRLQHRAAINYRTQHYGRFESFGDASLNAHPPCTTPSPRASWGSPARAPTDRPRPRASSRRSRGDHPYRPHGSTASGPRTRSRGARTTSTASRSTSTRTATLLRLRRGLREPPACRRAPPRCSMAMRLSAGSTPERYGFYWLVMTARCAICRCTSSSWETPTGSL